MRSCKSSGLAAFTGFYRSTDLHVVGITQRDAAEAATTAERKPLHGELHSDPHPGNVLVTDDLKIIFLDFGSVTLIDDATRREYLRLVMAFVANDRDTVVDALHTIGFRTKSGRPDTLLVFADALLGSFAKAQGEAQFPTKEELIAEAKNVIAVAEHDPVLTLPPEFIMIARVFGSISGLFLVHRPKLDVATWILPALGRALAR